jgi:hypothetical protein
MNNQGELSSGHGNLSQSSKMYRTDTKKRQPDEWGVRSES